MLVLSSTNQRTKQFIHSFLCIPSHPICQYDVQYQSHSHSYSDPSIISCHVTEVIVKATPHQTIKAVTKRNNTTSLPSIPLLAIPISIFIPILITRHLFIQEVRFRNLSLCRSQIVNAHLNNITHALNNLSFLSLASVLASQDSRIITL